MSTTSGARPTAVSASSPQSGAYTRSVRRFSSLGRKASMPSRSILRRLTRRMLELASSCSIFVAPDRLGATPLTEVYKCTQHRHSENADLCQRSADRKYAAVHYYLSRSGEQKRKKKGVEHGPRWARPSVTRCKNMYAQFHMRSTAALTIPTGQEAQWTPKKHLE